HRFEDEDRDLPGSLPLVAVVVRPDLDRSGPPGRPLVAGQLAGEVVPLLVAILELDVGVLLEVVVPDGILRRAALRGDDRVVAIMLDPHERGLAEQPGLRPDRG